MKVKNTSKRVIKLLNGKDKVTLLPGTEETYEVTDCADVQFLIDAGDLTEAAPRRGRPPSKPEDGKTPQASETKES